MDIYNLMLFFTIYSFLGWVVETIYASIRENRVINRGFLTGCFCPIYGFGAILVLQFISWITGVFQNCNQNYYMVILITIIFTIIFVTALEFVTGYFLERIFNRKWWDYSDRVLNFHGYICLRYSLLWGSFSFVLVQIVHPIVVGMVLTIPESVKGYLIIFLYIYFAVDTIKSVIDNIDLSKIIIHYSNISFDTYYKRIIQNKSLNRMLIVSTEILNGDIRSNLNERFGKFKIELKSRFL